MTLAGAEITLTDAGPVLETAPPLPVETLLLGRPAGEVAALLPRLFNLCPMAQGLAARMALGMDTAGFDTGAEILRDHAVKLCVTLPRAFGLPVIAMPVVTAPRLEQARGLLGAGGLPLTMAGLERWQAPLAGLARHLQASFAEGVAVTAVLPPAPPLAEGAFENSAAGRQEDHPLLQAVQARFGRGPLWRALGLMADLEAAVTGHLPAPRLRGGVAVVPAARGAYALRLTTAGGMLTGFARRTPTDHLLAPGGRADAGAGDPARGPAGLCGADRGAARPLRAGDGAGGQPCMR